MAEQTTYDPRMGPLDGSPQLIEHMKRRAAGTEEDAFRAEMLARLLQSALSGAQPKAKPPAPQRPTGTAAQALERAVQAGRAATAPAGPTGPAGAPNAAPGAPGVSGGPGGGQIDPMEALRALIGKQDPSGVGGLVKAGGTSKISLGNMIASRGGSPAVGPQDVLRGQRQQQIANMAGLISAETEIRKSSTASDRLNFDKLKFAFERGDAGAKAVIDVVDQFGQQMVGVEDRAGRTTKFWAELQDQLDTLPKGSSPLAVTALAGRIAAKHAEGARNIKSSGQTINIGSEKAFSKGVGEGQSKAYNETLTKADTATVNLGKVNQMLALQNEIKTGPIQQIFPTILGVAKDIGIDVEAFARERDIDLGNISSAAEFARLGGELSIEALGNFKGSTSNRELNYAISLQPGLGKDERSNQRALAAQQVFFERVQKYGAQLQTMMADQPNPNLKTMDAWRAWVRDEDKAYRIQDEVKERVAAMGDAPQGATALPAGNVPDYIYTPEGGMKKNPAKK